MQINDLAVFKVEKLGIEWVYILLYCSVKIYSKNDVWIKYFKNL